MSAPQEGPTLASIALVALRGRGPHTAFSWDGGEASGHAVLDLVGRYQHVYQRHGLRPGDRVGFLSSNRLSAWCAAIAAQASGMAVTWLQGLASVADHLYQLRDAEVAAVVVDHVDHAARAEQFVAELGGDVTVFVTGPAPAGIDLASQAEQVGASTPVDLSTPALAALLNYTGGTSGRPKGVLRSNRAAAVMHTSAVLAGFEFPRAPRHLAVAPYTHVGGTKLLPVLLRGGSVHLMTRFDPAEVLATVERERISTMLAVPTMIYALLGSDRLDATDLSSLELVLYGASPMSPARLAEAVERMGPVFSQLYGQTECYPITALHRSDHTPELATSCGAAVPTAQVRLLDADDREVAVGEAGEICVRSPSAMDGYWRNPELTAAAIRDGWVRTGDIARADERGFLFIADRKNDMIITGGFNVYPREVEDALTAHAGVAEASVFGVPDERWGEAVVAVVVRRAGHDTDDAELTAHVRGLKGPLQAPKRIVFADDLPKTAVGKVDRKLLRTRTINSEETR